MLQRILIGAERGAVCQGPTPGSCCGQTAWKVRARLWRLSTAKLPCLPPDERRALVDNVLAPLFHRDIVPETKAVLLGSVFQVLIPLSHPANYLQEMTTGERRRTRVSGSLFLVDGLLVSGNSGSPLVLPSELKVRRAPDSNQLQFATEQTKNYIIGIVSMGLDGSGLTVVYSADYILETVFQSLKGQRAKPPA